MRQPLLLQQRQLLLVHAAQRELEGLARAGGKVEELEELRVLAPGVDLALVGERMQVLPPVGDRREGIARAGAVGRPEVGEDARRRREEVDPGGKRDLAIGVAVVQRPGRIRVVRSGELDRAPVAVVELDLELHGIRLQADEPPGLDVLRKRHRAPVQVDQQVGRAVEALQPPFAHAEMTVAVVDRVIRPAVPEVEPT